jgi:general secretion pathway protein L
LIVGIPDRWEGAASPVAWALIRPDGTLASEGECLIADLPSAKRTTLVVAASRVLLATATLPSRGARRIRGALAYAIEDQLTSDPESVHAIAAGAPRGNRQSIAVIEREWLRGLIASFESAGVLPESVTVETCLPPIANGEWTLVLRNDSGFLRTGEAAGMNLDGPFDGSVPAMLRLAIDAARGAGGAPPRIVIRTDSPPDVHAWARKLGVPCEAAGPWRLWQCAERRSIEFLQGEFVRSNRGLSRLWPRLRPAAFLAASALAIEVVGTFCHWGVLRYEKAQLEARMTDQFKAAFPQARAIVDPALQMRRNLHAARTVAGMAQESDFLPLLAKAMRLDAGAIGRVKAIGYDTERLTLDIELSERNLADSVLKRLEEKDIGVRLEATRPKATSAEARLVFMPRGRK